MTDELGAHLMTTAKLLGTATLLSVAVKLQYPCGGFFLCRLKKQANPELLHSHQGSHSHLEGSKLKEAQEGRMAEVLDFAPLPRRGV